MVFNPMALFTPQQREDLAKMQVFTQKIHATVHSDGNRLEVTLNTDDAEAAKLIGQLIEAMVGTITQMLYQLFAVTGERV